MRYRAMTSEEQARFRMSLQGYRVRCGGIWLITNDDPEDFEETRITEWDGTFQDAYELLRGHGWPKSEGGIICPDCNDAPAEEFGGTCQACSKVRSVEDRGDMELSQREDR